MPAAIETAHEPRLKGDKFKVVIVGVRPLLRLILHCQANLPCMQAGLGGLAAAMAMHYAGYEVIVYEKIKKWAYPLSSSHLDERT